MSFEEKSFEDEINQCSLWSLGDNRLDVSKPPIPMIRMVDLNKFSEKKEGINIEKQKANFERKINEFAFTCRI